MNGGPESEQTLVSTTVFPNVRKLSIDLHHIPPRISPFIRAFPNLTYLHVDTGCYAWRYSVEDMQEIHQTNIAQQIGATNSCGTWAHLEHFRGPLYDLYTIGLTFHIPRLTIVSRSDNEWRTDVLATVLRYARPLHLKLESIPGSILGDADGGFISMLREGSSANLINLDIRIHFGRGDREEDLATVIVRFPLLHLCN